MVLGKVGALFGVRGWVKLWSFTDPPENLLGYREVDLRRQDDWFRAILVEARPHGEGFVGRFEGIDDRDAAASLIGCELAVTRDRLPPLAKGEFYQADLIGLEVINRDGVSLGRVKDVMATGANDVLVVDGDRERLVPFLLGRCIDELDLEGGRITVDWDPDF